MASAKRYLYGTPRQHSLLEGDSIHTLEDLLRRVAERDPRSLVSHPRGAVLKRSVVQYLNKRCGGLFLDVDKAVHDKEIRTGGAYPNQWIGAHLPAREPRSRRRDPIQNDLCRDFNAGILDDDEALFRALSLSEEDTVLPSSPPSSTDRVLTGWSDDDDDDELCCPITCERFRDPVQTLHGQTYERSAILDWFSTHRTDPLTGVPLLTTHVWPDDEMRERCGGGGS